MTDSTVVKIAPDLRETECFLKLLGDGDDDWTFQTLDDQRGRNDSQLIRIFHSTQGRVAPDLIRLNQAGAGVFAMVNRGDCRGRRAENVMAVRAVFVDLDGTPLSVIDGVALEPHLVVESSPGRYHVYWRIEDLPLQLFQRVQKALALQLKADPSVNDLPRLMRLPGFYHRKGAPFLSRIMESQPLQPYRARDFLKAFRIPETSTRPLLKAVPSGTVIIRPGSRNTHLASLAGTMRRRDMTRAAIEAALMAENAEHCRPPLDDEEVTQIADSISRYSPSEDSSSVGTEVISVRASRVRPERVQWLWPNRIPLSKVTVIAGDPGLGKSLLTATLAAHVSQGTSWPLDGGACPQGDVVLLSAEDDPGDTIRPRLDAAGADPERVEILTAVRKIDQGSGKVTKQMFSLRADLDALGELLERCHECRLVVVDPISAYLDGTDSHRNADVRALLAPLADLAARRRVAIVCVSHLNKGTGGNAMYRAMGSLAFVAAARAYLMVAKDPDDDSRRLLLQGKSNLGPECEGIAYTVAEAENGAAMLVWSDDPVTVSLAEALSTTKREEAGASTLDRAAEWLEQLLSEGSSEHSEIERLATKSGFAMRTVTRAKQQLGIVSQRKGFGRGATYVWSLPCRPQQTMQASLPRMARMGVHDDRAKPQLPLAVSRTRERAINPSRKLLKKAWNRLGLPWKFAK